MGRTRNSGLGVGTGSSPQVSVSQGNVDAKVEELNKEIMIQPLIDAGVKFNKDDVLFVTKDKTGQTVWLETGNENAGLKHILYGNNIKPGHAKDFEKALGLDSSKVPEFLNRIITKGDVIENKLTQVGNKIGYRRTYYYEGNYYIVTAIGTNGFIVTAYPKKMGGK